MRLHWRVLTPAVVTLVAGAALGVALVRGEKERGAVATGPTAAAASDDATDDTGRLRLDPFTVAVQDFNYGEVDFPATRDKAQSKLWYHDGSWWAPMIDPFTSEVHIFELREGRWADTHVFVDARATSNADVVWTGSKLFIASRTSTGELLLQRYTYANRTWVPTSTAPQLIRSGGGQSLTIAVDSQERVWASWVQGGRVWIAHSQPGGTGWTVPVTPPGGESVQDDDAVAVTEFQGQIGVLYSNQEHDAFYWTSRSDAAPPEQWAEQVTVAQGVNIADGHINFAASPTGELFAAVKTSLGDNGEPQSSALIEVLRRATDGTWTTSTAATVGNQMTRAQLLVTADGQHLILVATSPQTGGALYYKIANTADGRFAPGKGSLLLTWPHAVINDATATRAPVDPSIPLVVLACDSSTGEYYHAELSLEDVL